MGVMEMRRRLMESMAKGVEVLKGTFTAPDAGSNYVLNFGKSFNEYIYIIEMADSSKQTLMQSEYDVYKAYARLGKYPIFKVGEISPFDTTHMSVRVNPSSQVVATYAAAVTSINESSITLSMSDVSTSTATNSIYRGYTYNYTIISLDNI